MILSLSWPKEKRKHLSEMLKRLLSKNKKKRKEAPDSGRLAKWVRVLGSVKGAMLGKVNNNRVM